MLPNRLGNTQLSLKLLIGAVVILLILCSILLTKTLRASAKIQDLQAHAQTSKQIKIVEFGDQFVEKVLKAEKEVDFETRLALENDVRELDDPEIKAQWEKFTSSETEEDAQNQVKELLDLIFTKIRD